MADFNFYLNRQGSRGLTGEKGDTGFSPIISVLSDTATEYILNIQNETTSFQTPNLRPPVAEGEGSYVRVNELGNWYIGEPSLATQEEVGMVQLSDIIDANDDRTAVTPNLVVDYVDSHIQDLDSNLVHKTGTEFINGAKTFNNRTYFLDGFTNQGGDLWFRKDNSDTARIATTTGGIYVIPSSGKKFYYGTAEVATKTDINIVQSNLNTTNANVTTLEGKTTSLESRTNALEVAISNETNIRYSADSQLQSHLDAERREREIQDASLQGQLDSKLTVDNIKAGSNITLTKDGNSVTISSTGGGGGSGDVTAAGNNVFTGTNTFKQIIVDDAVGAPEAEWVNNRVVLKYTYDKIPYLDRTFAGIAYVTIDGSQIPVDVDPINVKSYLLHQYSVEGSETIEVTQTDKGIQLSANLDEIGGEVNALANRVSTNETAIESLDERVTDLEESGSGIAKFPNATIFGEPTIQAGQVSDLFNGNYLQFPFALEHKGRAWECNLCFTTHLNDVSTQQNIIDSRCSIALAVRNRYLVLALSSNGTTFDIGEFTMSQIQISPHTTYYVKITYQPTVGYTMKADTKEIDDSSPTYVIGYPNTPIASTLMTISSPTQSFYGSINLNNWDLYVEDLLVWQGMDDVGLSTRLDTNLSNVSEIGKQTIKDMITELNPIQRASGDLTCDKPEYFATSPVHLMSCNGRQYYKNNDKPALMAWILKEGTAWGGGKTYFNIPILVSNDIEATYQHCVQGGDPNYGAIEEFDYKGVHWYVTEVSYAWEYNYSVTGGVAIKFGDTYPNLTTAAKELIDFTNAKMDNKDVYQFYTKEEIDEKIGDIGTILDNINGEDIE